MAIQLDRQIMQAPGVRARVGVLYESGLGRTAEFSDRTPTPRPSLKAFFAHGVTLGRGTDWQRRCGLEVAFNSAELGAVFLAADILLSRPIDEERTRKINLVLESMIRTSYRLYLKILARSVVHPSSSSRPG